MKQIKKLFRDEKGVTLVELLAALAISTLVMTTIYGVYLTGVKAYKVIGVEGQIRDEADYVVSRIMSSIYDLSPDTIKPCPGEVNCFELINDNRLVVSKNDNQLVEEVEKDELDITVTKLRLAQNQILLNDEVLNKTNILLAEETSSITFKCTNEEAMLGSNEKRCVNGIFDIQLTLENSDYTEESPLHVKPLTLTSKFGY
ncbi:prepilin-type N-terminal cleavage/methylation domain-containing protein [Bacillus sp. BGMRC 2118]|nr:prepilin-type N-terminal cleavage/methylation domain-containing protein [Bacillus sp. BGMRC 2118]